MIHSYNISITTSICNINNKLTFIISSALHLLSLQNEQAMMTYHLCLSRVFMSHICFHITISEATISDETVSHHCKIKFITYSKLPNSVCAAEFLLVLFSLKVRGDVCGSKDIF